jgi:serine/threonine protein kinase
MLTGALPFTATEPMAWVHCHIARPPMPPEEWGHDLPGPITAIVMKLLAKTAEDRYQTAAGVAADLRRCLAAWEARGQIDPFPLGAHDVSDRLLLPEKLYGREREIARLLATFDRVVARGTPALVLVSGAADIGKSAVVHELRRALVPPRSTSSRARAPRRRRPMPRH